MEAHEFLHLKANVGIQRSSARMMFGETISAGFEELGEFDLIKIGNFMTDAFLSFGYNGSPLARERQRNSAGAILVHQSIEEFARNSTQNSSWHLHYLVNASLLDRSRTVQIAKKWSPALTELSLRRNLMVHESNYTMLASVPLEKGETTIKGYLDARAKVGDNLEGDAFKEMRLLMPKRLTNLLPLLDGDKSHLVLPLIRSERHLGRDIEAAICCALGYVLAQKAESLSEGINDSLVQVFSSGLLRPSGTVACAEMVLSSSLELGVLDDDVLLVAGLSRLQALRLLRGGSVDDSSALGVLDPYRHQIPRRALSALLREDWTGFLSAIRLLPSPTRLAHFLTFEKNFLNWQAQLPSSLSAQENIADFHQGCEAIACAGGVQPNSRGLLLDAKLRTLSSPKSASIITLVDIAPLLELDPTRVGNEWATLLEKLQSVLAFEGKVCISRFDEEFDLASLKASISQAFKSNEVLQGAFPSESIVMQNLRELRDAVDFALSS